MAYDYDALYRTTPDALGPPTKAVVALFRALPCGRLRILDVGCGQGRDALFLGRMGHEVLGIDLSPAGIEALNATARAEGLDVTGLVADITGPLPDRRVDVVLLDRTLHMLERHSRPPVLSSLLDRIDPGGFCVIVDEPRHIDEFVVTARTHPAEWELRSRRGGFLVLARAA